jgi:hypothetical protein
MRSCWGAERGVVNLMRPHWHLPSIVFAVSTSVEGGLVCKRVCVVLRIV